MDVVIEARSWMTPPTPFRHQGFHKGVGCDCIGLIKGLSIALKLTSFNPDSAEARAFDGYRRSPDPRRMREGISRWMRPIPWREAVIGDVYFMVWQGEPQHVALVSDIGIIHAYSMARKVVEHRIDAEWRSRICDAWRFPVFMGGGV